MESGSINQSNRLLGKVAKGAGVVFFGLALAKFLSFLSRIVIARFFSTSEYGLFSLGFALVSFFSLVAVLGIPKGTTRYMAFFRGNGQIERIGGVVSWSILLCIVSSLAITFLVVSWADFLAVEIFRAPEFGLTLSVFAFSIPFLAFIYVLISIYRGLMRVSERFFFSDFLRNLLFLLFLAPVLFLDLPFVFVACAFTVSIALASLLFGLYALVKRLVLFPGFSRSDFFDFDLSVARMLLIFSLPLLLVDFLQQVMAWTDTLMLGFFASPELVGLYNAAAPLTKMLSVVLTSTVFLYGPMVSELYARSLIGDIKRTYVVLTKWISSATFPLLCVFLFFPSQVLLLFFGQDYVVASMALQVLALGFFLNNLLGPNGATLIAFGDTRFLMWTSLVAAFLNVILNFLLIPVYGIVGAALASVSSFLAINVLRVLRLRSSIGLFPFDMKLVRSILVYLFFIVPLFLVSDFLVSVDVLFLLLVFIFFYFGYILSVFLARGLDDEDLELMNKFAQHAGVNLDHATKLLEKYV